VLNVGDNSVMVAGGVVGHADDSVDEQKNAAERTER